MNRIVMAAAALALGLAIPASAQQQTDAARAPKGTIVETGPVQSPAGSKNGVSAPRLLSSADPQYSREARRKKISGDVLVRLVVDEQGLPQDITVEKGIGYGLDENAVNAVKRYRFAPALKDGVPVKVDLRVSVHFRIF